MTITVPHRCTLEDALARASALGEYFVNRHGMQLQWESERVAHLTGRYMLISFDATFTLTEAKVQIDGKDPGFLLRSKAQDYLRRKVNEYLDPAVPLDALPRR